MNGIKGIIYAASICYPQSDLYVPLRLTVSADGKISFFIIGVRRMIW